jgi:hypothetical protein
MTIGLFFLTTGAVAMGFFTGATTTGATGATGSGGGISSQAATKPRTEKRRRHRDQVPGIT